MALNRTRSIVMLSSLFAAAGSTARATVLFQDNFDSYADTTAMQAVWGSAGGGTLDTTTAGAGVASMRHAGLPDNPTDSSHVFNAGAVLPTDAKPIVWQFDFYWDGNGNKRMTGGLRDNGNGEDLNSLLEMGYYNDALNPVTNDDSDEGFAYRTALLPGSTNWILFTNPDNSGALTRTGLANTWMTFRAVIKASSIIFSVDLGRDGTIDSTATVAADSSESIYNIARFGGPSSLSSSGGGANFDNLSISTVLLGDANGNGRIDADDYAALDRGLAKNLSGFANGDYDFNNTINASDYLVIDAAFATQGGAFSPDFLATRQSQFGDAYVSGLLASVPEPTLGLPAISLLVWIGTRRRRRSRTNT